MGLPTPYLNAMKDGVFECRPLFPGARILDIGAQDLYWGRSADYAAFLSAFGDHDKLGGDIDAICDDFARRNAPFGSGAAMADLMALTNFTYRSVDLCQQATLRVDLNTWQVPPEHANAYDLVLNFGTTEHIFNQPNCFRVIHDAVRVGGLMFHSLPMAGHYYHCFFKYDPKLFLYLAAANGYQLVYAGLVGSGESAIDERHTTWAGSADFLGKKTDNILSVMVLRKLEEQPFRFPVDLVNDDPRVSVAFSETLKSVFMDQSND